MDDQLYRDRIAVKALEERAALIDAKDKRIQELEAKIKRLEYQLGAETGRVEGLEAAYKRIQELEELVRHLRLYVKGHFAEDCEVCQRVTMSAQPKRSK